MKKLIISIIFLIVVIIAVFVLVQNDNGSIEYEYTVAERGNIIQEVDVTGRVQAVEAVDLAFERSGRVVTLNNEVGTMVEEGAILLQLDQRSLQAKLAQANAGVTSAQARLNQFKAALSAERSRLSELQSGAREEDIQVAQTKLDNAIKSKTDAEHDLQNVINQADRDLQDLYDRASDYLNDAYIAVDDALNIKTDDMFSDSFANKGGLVFMVSDINVEEESKTQRNESLNILDSLSAQLANPLTSQREIDNILSSTKNDLTAVQSFLFTLTQALANELNLNDATKTVFQANVDAARDSISFARNAISQQIQQIEAQKVANDHIIDATQYLVNNAINSITLAQDELHLKNAGASSNEIMTQEASVRQAEANVASQLADVVQARANVTSALADLATTELIAPLSGIVTDIDVKVGEIVAPNVPVISIIAEENLEIVALIPEADITKVAIGNKARLTLDAYDEDILFDAIVVNIDPAAELTEGVATYKTTLVFTKSDDLIRAGMTTDMDIVTAQRDDVIIVPQRAVIFKGDKKIVRILQDSGAVEEVDVEVGVTGNRGVIEIISGVSEGDKVVTSTKNNQ